MVCSTARVPWRRLVTGRGNGAERTYVDIDTFTATFGTAHACGTRQCVRIAGFSPGYGLQIQAFDAYEG